MTQTPSGKSALLIIMDGWGHGKQDHTNAIYQADTPFIDSLYHTTPHAELRTDGENVGLPAGQMGNSEVGHLNIGAGRIVYQDLVKINNEIESKAFFRNPVIVAALDKARARGNKIHLMGLLSDGGIHSSQDHLHALLDACSQHNIADIYVHAFLDGRDTDPQNGVKYIQRLQEKMKQSGGRLASVIGRYYAMDRDQRWERTRLAYDLLIHGKGEVSDDIISSVKNQYDKGVTDEFMIPIISKNLRNNAKIQSGDVVICYNYRTDRCRQISTVLTQQDMPNVGMQTVAISYYTMTRYDHKFTGIDVFYDKDNLQMTLGEVVSKTGLTQVRMAETEKYPHVTFFFSGGREKEFDGEKRIMVNSPKVATYDLQPEMSADVLLDKAIRHLKEVQPNLAILNFANPDMVGHTGVIPAIIKAVETIDSHTRKLSETALENNYEIIIIADHGNAELNIHPDGSPHTAHTTNPVPVFYLGTQFTSIKNGILADVAPSLLHIMGIAIPKEMTGKSLLS